MTDILDMTGDVATVDESSQLTFDQLTVTNESRCRRWHPGFPTDDAWNGADWSNAMQGEAGEAGNVVKKLRRIEGAFQDARRYDREELVAKLAEECADTVIYLDLLATYYGINLPDAIRRKFNLVSEREGFPERL